MNGHQSIGQIPPHQWRDLAQVLETATGMLALAMTTDAARASTNVREHLQALHTLLRMTAETCDAYAHITSTQQRRN